LGIVFIYASVGKILYPADFLISIRSYRLLPSMLIKPIAYALPWIEITFGVLLTLGVLVRFSAIVLSLLLAVFIAAITSALIRGIDINCGCFIQKLLENEQSFRFSDGLLLILRDILFLIPGAFLVLSSKKRTRN
jgi:uncharacterized membrane protein YphA (DoxX/SURF4 family)